MPVLNTPDLTFSILYMPETYPAREIAPENAPNIRRTAREIAPEIAANMICLIIYTAREIAPNVNIRCSAREIAPLMLTLGVRLEKSPL